MIILMLTVLFIQTSAIAKAESEKEPLVTMMLFETDLREALNEISLQTGVSIIPDQTVGGVVTADLQKVPLEKALKKILVGGGYTFLKIDDFYLVGLPDPKSNTFGDLSKVEVVKLNHIRVRKVLDLLPSFLRNYVNGRPDNNLLTITAPPRELKRIKKLINKLDQPQKEVEVKVVITEIDSQKVKELGSSLLEYSEESVGNKSFSYDMEENLLAIQKDINGKLLTELKAMEEEHKAKIKADPRIAVADGESAELFIGDRQVLLITSKDEDITSRIEEVEVGVRLKISADILSKEEVLLNIAPEISRFVDEERPDLVVKHNSLSTTLRLKSGQTAAIAGMTIQDNSFYNKKVPILGDIPIIRWLFSTDTTRKNNRELLVFVTPVVK
jgi:type IV pilus assembly protein PilQ